jgi:hypothetical protein
MFIGGMKNKKENCQIGKILEKEGKVKSRKRRFVYK